MLLAYGMIVMILMSLGVALTQMKVFSFKEAVITSIDTEGIEDGALAITELIDQ